MKLCSTRYWFVFFRTRCSNIKHCCEGSARDSVDETCKQQCIRCMRKWLVKPLKRAKGILDVIMLVFGIIIYLADVGTDIVAAVLYFQEGHLVWGSLTIAIVLLSAVCWAAVSWTWWYYDDEKDKHSSYRRTRMLLSVLLLDPLVR